MTQFSDKNLQSQKSMRSNLSKKSGTSSNTFTTRKSLIGQGQNQLGLPKQHQIQNQKEIKRQQEEVKQLQKKIDANSLGSNLGDDSPIKFEASPSSNNLLLMPMPKVITRQVTGRNDKGAEQGKSSLALPVQGIMKRGDTKVDRSKKNDNDTDTITTNMGGVQFV